MIYLEKNLKEFSLHKKDADFRIKEALMMHLGSLKEYILKYDDLVNKVEILL